MYIRKKTLDLLIRGLDNFTTMEPYFAGLKCLRDNSYYMTLNIPMLKSVLIQPQN